MIKIQENISLKDYSTFQIGGLAKYFVLVENISQLIEALRWTKEKNLHFSIVGSGSNVLFLDNGYQGLIIKVQFSNTIVQDSRVICGAGTMMNKVLSVAAANKLTGFEWAAGIPGTIGGGVFGNAGAFGWEMKSIIKTVKAINSQNFQIENFDNEQCEFSYRSSVFKRQQRNVIVEAELKLKKGDQEEIRTNIKSNLLYRKERHPLNYPSVGSVFKNVKLTKEKLKLIEKFPDLEQFSGKGEIPAAYLVHCCGLKGKIIGGAQISDKHPNFIININNASAEDVITLMSLVKQRVRNKFSLQLEEEIVFI